MCSRGWFDDSFDPKALDLLAAACSCWLGCVKQSSKIDVVACRLGGRSCPSRSQVNVHEVCGRVYEKKKLDNVECLEACSRSYVLHVGVGLGVMLKFC